jgi:hypothetical protein
MQNKYKRIDNRLVLEMEVPSRDDILYMSDYWKEYNSRPSFEINPSDLDKFNFVDGYEKDKHFYTAFTHESGDGSPFAFALPKDIDMSGEDEQDKLWYEAALTLYNSHNPFTKVDTEVGQRILRGFAKDMHVLKSKYTLTPKTNL